MVFVYNPKLVRAGEITTWRDLLNPTWKGKIALADPSVSGSSYTALVTMLCAVEGEADDILRAFAENLDGKQLESSGAVLSYVAGGQAVVGVTLEETASRHIAAGGELAMVYPCGRNELRAGWVRDFKWRAACGKRPCVCGFYGQPGRAAAHSGAVLQAVGAKRFGVCRDAAALGVHRADGL